MKTSKPSEASTAGVSSGHGERPGRRQEESSDMNQPRQPAPRLSTLLSRGWRPVDPPRRAVLFVNPRSGDGAASRHGVVELARERGVEAVTLGSGDDLTTRVVEVVEDGADALGMAGGDGSLAVVAAVAAARGLPFVCIPVGTRNHFALDLGVDRQDVPGALDAFTDGMERLIDVGDVNGRLFLNNVSLGIYGEAVRQPTYRDAKARTLLETAVEVLGPSAAAADLQLADDRGDPHRNPSILLVSNNPYALEPPHAPGTRPTLDSGRLGVIVLDAPLPGRSAGRAWTATRLEVTAPAPVHAGVDGEAVDLTPPLRFVIRHNALRVRVPSSRAVTPPLARLP